MCFFVYKMFGLVIKKRNVFKLVLNGVLVNDFNKFFDLKQSLTKLRAWKNFPIFNIHNPEICLEEWTHFHYINQYPLSIVCILGIIWSNWQKLLDCLIGFFMIQRVSVSSIILEMYFLLFYCYWDLLGSTQQFLGHQLLGFRWSNKKNWIINEAQAIEKWLRMKALKKRNKKKFLLNTNRY